MTPLEQALLLSFLAGAAIPAGGLLAAVEHIHPRWLEDEFRHTVIAFGGGALLAAVALVLVPEGVAVLSVPVAAGAFLGGGVAFMLLDRAIAKHGGTGAQFLAMLLDFVPEAMALGAAFAAGGSGGPLLAFLIGIQNLPEGFNAFREVTDGKNTGKRGMLAKFAALSLVGPASAYIGITLFATRPEALGVLMLVAAGGILYLTFQDIAPQARLKRSGSPALGAVVGFLMGMVGAMVAG